MKKIYHVSKEYLEDNYIKQNKSARAICKELGIKSKTTIYRLLKKYNIEPHKDRTGVPQPNAKKYGELHQSYLYLLKSRATRRNLDFNLNGEYLWQLFINQNRKCALSGMDIKMPKTWGAKTKTDMTASIDRIDCSKGYIKGNVQWVHKTVNYMRMDLEISEFIQICKKVANHT